jgi:hypothetical protein
MKDPTDRAETDRDAAMRLLAATEQALDVMAADFVKLSRCYGRAQGKPDERATYWMEAAVLSNFIAYEAIRRAERGTKGKP